MKAEIYPSFDDFWDLYDYKTGKKKALKAWTKISQKEREKLMNHIPRYVAMTNTDGRFPSRKHPTTYLNSESWNDEQQVIEDRRATPYDTRAFIGGLFK